MTPFGWGVVLEVAMWLGVGGVIGAVWWNRRRRGHAEQALRSTWSPSGPGTDPPWWAGIHPSFGTRIDIPLPPREGLPPGEAFSGILLLVDDAIEAWLAGNNYELWNALRDIRMLALAGEAVVV